MINECISSGYYPLSTILITSIIYYHLNNSFTLSSEYSNLFCLFLYFFFFISPLLAVLSTRFSNPETEHRLTEQEANDEIRMLLQNFVVQLQTFKDRIPSRGSAMTTIGILLENCKPITNPPPSTTLKPPTLAGSSLAIKKTNFTTTNNSTMVGGDDGGHSMNGGSNIKQCVDKSTNTNTTMITPSTVKNGGFDHFQSTTMVQRLNGSVTQISITDESITTIDPNTIQINETNESKEGKKDSSDDNNQTMNDVTNRDLEFFSLKLQCMCSGSEEDSISQNDGMEMKPIEVVAAADGDETVQTIETVPTMANVTTCDDGHQCSHCGRNHCCFFLHCCYCKKHGNLDIYIHPSSSNCNNATNQNVLASERCDAICKKQQFNNQMSMTMAMTTMTTTTNTNINECECRAKFLTNQKCCDNDSDTKCHCRWYCIQDCNAGNNRLNVQNLELCGASNQYEEPMRSNSTNAMDQSMLDENRLKCCRCAKELF